MTPEQQIREALEFAEETAPASGLWPDALAALDRLVAERDEARQGVEYALACLAQWQQDAWRARKTLAMLWEHYLLPLTDAQRAHVRAALADPLDPPEALVLAKRALDRHDLWCGHNRDAPGDSSYNEAQRALAAVPAADPTPIECPCGARVHKPCANPNCHVRTGHLPGGAVVPPSSEPSPAMSSTTADSGDPGSAATGRPYDPKLDHPERYGGNNPWRPIG